MSEREVPAACAVRAVSSSLNVAWPQWGGDAKRMTDRAHAPATNEGKEDGIDRRNSSR